MRSSDSPSQDYEEPELSAEKTTSISSANIGSANADPINVVVDDLDEYGDISGTILNDHFQIISRIGEGGMSHVYEAYDVLLKKTVAVKMLRPHLLQQPNAVRRLQQEARATSHLDHPHCVGIRHFGIASDGAPYLVMDFVKGQSLHQVLKQCGHFSQERALSIFCQIAQALSHAHSQGIIHRDLKPSNILIVEQPGNPDFVKIVDFGIARLIAPDDSGITSNVTMTGEVFGSPLAMSPEQCRGDKADARSDIYSFGCLMYETLTGKPVFTARNSLEVLFKQMHDTPDNFKAVNPKAKISPKLESIVFKALKKEPKNRYQTMESILEDLEGIPTTSTMQFAMASLKLAAKNTRRNRRLAINCAVSIAVLTGAFLLTHRFFSAQTSLVHELIPWQETAGSVADELNKTLKPLAQANRDGGTAQKAIDKQKLLVRVTQHLKDMQSKIKSHGGDLTLSKEQALALMTMLGQDADELYRYEQFNELEQVANAAGHVVLAYSNSIPPGQASLESSRKIASAIKRLGDEQFAAKQLEQAMETYGTGLRLAEKVAKPQSSDAGYFAYLCANCFYAMAETKQNFGPGTYNDAIKDYTEFLTYPQANRILMLPQSKEVDKERIALSYWRRADCERLSKLQNVDEHLSDEDKSVYIEAAERVCDDYQAGELNFQSPDAAKRAHNLALSNAYIVFTADQFDLAPERWHKESENSIGIAVEKMQKPFASDSKTLTLLNRQYAKSLWHHAGRAFAEQNYLQSMGDFSKAVLMCLKINTWI